MSRLIAARSTVWSFGELSERVTRASRSSLPATSPRRRTLRSSVGDQAWRLVAVAFLHEPRQHLQHAERLANLVTDQAAEAAQLSVLSFDGLGIAVDERIDGLALQFAHGLRRSTHCQHGSCRVGPLAERRGLAREERFEDFAEQLVFAQHLVHRRLLVEPQQTEFGRLGHHRRVGGNLLLGGGAHVGRDFADQLGDVIEELMRGEHVTSVDVEQLVESLEPRLSQRRVLCHEPRSEVVHRCREVGTGHAGQAASCEYHTHKASTR